MRISDWSSDVCSSDLRAAQIQAEDIMSACEIMLSVFVRDPQFQSQTKDSLTSPEAARLVENAERDHFDHFLSDNMERGKALLNFVLDRMEDRRSEERRVGKECVSPCRSRGSPDD